MSNYPNLPDTVRYKAVHVCEPSSNKPSGRREERPVTLLSFALGWLVLSGLGAGMVAVLVVGGLNRLGWLAWRDFEVDVAALGLPLQQGLMVAGAVRRGWRVGVGDLRAGLGWLPMRRLWLVVALVGCALLLDAAQVGLWAVLPGVRDFLERGAAAPEMARPLARGGAYLLWFAATVAIGAPVAEELFFRGWLWVGLRRRWGAWGTGLTTGAMFLLMHGIGGEWRLLVTLAPVTVVLSLAREFGGSVRASLAVHMVNNVVFAACLAVGWLTG